PETPRGSASPGRRGGATSGCRRLPLRLPGARAPRRPACALASTGSRRGRLAALAAARADGVDQAQEIVDVERFLDDGRDRLLQEAAGITREGPARHEHE